MKLNLYIKLGVILLTSYQLVSCEDFVEVDSPNNKLIRDQVFENEETAISAMTGIYNELYQSAFSNGSRTSVTVISGLSGDNIRNINTTNLIPMEFQEHEIAPTNSNNLELWNSAYNLIYITNSFLEGLQNSNDISIELKQQLEGEARFVRAFTYFYLVNLYGEIPLILTTDYRSNSIASKTSIEQVYNQITEDLQFSFEILSITYRNGERTSVNKFAAGALLAKVYLYQEKWQLAENLSTQVIGESTTYQILENLSDVFLANSPEAIWQISPIGGGGIVTNTNEGNLFIIDPFFSFFASFQLANDFVNQFGADDNRLVNWIGFNTAKNAFFSHKYKIRNSNQFPILEYSMVLRLAEQYLIRAEARVEQDKISEAIEDLDIIRNRAGLESLAVLDPNISKADLLDEIFIQRRKELFAEWGNRWFDLKRSNRVQEVFEDQPLWESTDIYYPIPSEELSKNPNLIQNDGY